MIRWKIAILVAVAIAISYLDRQALPVATQASRNRVDVGEVTDKRAPPFATSAAYRCVAPSRRA